MAFPDYDYDLYEDFEGAPSASWTITDPDNNVDFQSTNNPYRGSQSIEFYPDGSTVGKDDDWYAVYDVGTAETPVSVGFWLYSPVLAASSWNNSVVGWIGSIATGGNYTVKIYWKNTTGTPQISIRGSGGFTTYINLSEGAWYWITIKAEQNSTCTINVYNTSESLVGSETTTGYNFSCRYIGLGSDMAYDWSDTDVYFYIDELVADWTDASFPLLGWETTASGATDVSVSESLSISDTPSFSQNRSTSIADTLTISDVGEDQSSRVISVLENLSISDALELFSDHFSVISDLLEISDNVSTGTASQVSVIENLNISDILTITQNRSNIVIENLEISDLNNLNMNITVTINESLQIADLIDYLKDKSVICIDGLSMSDMASIQGDIPSDNIGIAKLVMSVKSGTITMNIKKSSVNLIVN